VLSIGKSKCLDFHLHRGGNLFQKRRYLCGILHCVIFQNTLVFISTTNLAFCSQRFVLHSSCFQFIIFLKGICLFIFVFVIQTCRIESIILCDLSVFRFEVNCVRNTCTILTPKKRHQAVPKRLSPYSNISEEWNV
jgi:hypothetical protein